LSKRADARAILISMGEPAGIGPEIAVKAWAALGGAVDGRPLMLAGDPEIFRDAARLSGVDTAQLADAFVETGRCKGVKAGRPSADNAKAVTGAIAESVGAIRGGKAAALVTAPIHKSVLTGAGFGFPGHTEYLGHLTGAALPVMMLASHRVTPVLRVVPVTIHISLRDVLERLKADNIVAAGETVAAALKHDFGIAAPRLAVAGLNPHAGEDGTMGKEDRAIVAPAVAKLRAQGVDAAGPLSADTLFHDAARARYDAAICMYHDQALIPIKTLGFWSGVNVTLGLPIVRTSPDHGTALDIAGRGIAKAESMIAAIEMAAEIATRRGL
jgi:4-hydroxythreonine-4-phosphate dehydrogenase